MCVFRTTTTTATTYDPPVECPMAVSKLARNYICDDVTNTLWCDFDGGDCCLPDCNYTVFRELTDGILTEFNVSGCRCIPNVDTNTSCNISDAKHVIRDGVCNDITNNPECLFDGGDCCLPSAIRYFLIYVF